MRLYQEWKGIIWEFNSVGEFLLHIVCRIIGAIIGYGILFLIILWLAWYGSK
jgi:hypothetical protein